MKYILRYETKSKYIGFVKIHYEEFEKIEDLINYLLIHGIKNYNFYVRK